MYNQPFGEIFKSLRGIGEAINKELEQQIPLFENQIKSFSEELIRQLDEFRRQLEKASPPEKQQSYGIFSGKSRENARLPQGKMNFPVG